MLLTRVQVQDEAFSRVSVIMEVGDDKGYQWKTHPFIDRALHAQQGVLALKDAERQYQIGASLPILKWRMQVRPPPFRLPRNIQYITDQCSYSAAFS